MSSNDKDIRSKERAVKLQMWMAGRSSRNRNLIDKLCRIIITKVSTPKPEDDFLRDPLIDNDEGFDPDELDRFQRGESI